MERRPPRSTRTYTLCPYTTLFRCNRVADIQRSMGARPSDPAGRRLNGSRAEKSARPGKSVERHRRFQHRGSVREPEWRRSEEHTSELQSLMRISYAVFCLKKKTT